MNGSLQIMFDGALVEELLLPLPVVVVVVVVVAAAAAAVTIPPPLKPRMNDGTPRPRHCRRCRLR